MIIYPWGKFHCDTSANNEDTRHPQNLHMYTKNLVRSGLQHSEKKTDFRCLWCQHRSSIALLNFS